MCRVTRGKSGGDGGTSTVQGLDVRKRDGSRLKVQEPPGGPRENSVPSRKQQVNVTHSTINDCIVTAKVTTLEVLRAFIFISQCPKIT